MYHYKFLELALRKFYQESVSVNGYSEESAADMLGEMDFRNLLQAVRNEARTVYAYTTQGKEDTAFNYRGRELFFQRATLLQEEYDLITADDLMTDHTYELWLLENMSFVVTSCVSVDLNDGAYHTEYRDIISIDPWSSPMLIDLEDLTETLLEMCADASEGKIPFYEL